VSEYLTFQRHAIPGRKTPVVGVYSARSGEMLGRIAWFGRWRQFAFFPEPGTAWNPECLEAVNGQVRDLMAKRRAS
jgi:hypothetical protein